MLEMQDWKEMKERLDLVADGYYPSQAYEMIFAHLQELAQAGDGAELDASAVIYHYEVYWTLGDLNADFDGEYETFEAFEEEMDEGRNQAWLLTDDEGDRCILVFKECGF